MNKLLIKDIALQNFRSYGNKTQIFTFPKPGEAMLVEGDVGAGKSSIIDGIVYLLVGSKAFPRSVVNCISQKKCLVQGNMVLNNKEVEIVRGTKPSKFNVTGLGKSVNQDLQARLDQMLHITSKQALYNICLLSSDKTLPFFSLDKQERLKFLRNFVDSSLLDSLLEMAKSETAALKMRVLQKETRVTSLKENAERLEKMIRETLLEAQNKQTELEEEKQNIVDNIGPDEELQEAKEQLELLEKELEILNTDAIEAGNKVASVTAECNIHQKAWNEVKGALPNVQTAADVDTACDKQIEEQRGSLVKVEKLIAQIEEVLKTMPPEEQFEKVLAAITEEITKWKQSIKDSETEIKNLQTNLQTQYDQKKSLMADQDRIESEECSAYFESLIIAVDQMVDTITLDIKSVTENKEQSQTTMEKVQKDLEKLQTKYEDFKELTSALANNQSQQSDINYSISTLEKEKDTFVDLITAFVSSNSDVAKAKAVQDELSASIEAKGTLHTGLVNAISVENEQRERLAVIDSEIEKNEPQVDKLRTELESVHKDLVDEQVDEDELKRTSIVVSSYRDILDDVWAYITQKIIPQLNAKLPYYTEKLGLGFSMKLDPKNLTKPLFSGRPGITNLSLKDDLSNGQKRLISMALAHSLRDMEASVRGIQVGWMVVDEFSNSLSPARVEHVMDFEKQYAKDNGIALIVISHDVALKAYKWDHRVEITRDNYSRIHQK